MTTTDLLSTYKELNETSDRPECYEKVTAILLAILKELKERVTNSPN